tara:strand:- start:56 stop:730 length:675 start_codon:yes stop_codon:yes gene_type:complete
MTPRHLKVGSRRRKRIKKGMRYLLNPFVWFFTALPVIALLQIIKQPTPIWQYLIGLPLALLLLSCMVGGFIGLFDGETIFIISEKPIVDLKNSSLSEGKFIAKNIEVIDQLLSKKNLQMLSSFWEPKVSSVWYEPYAGIKIFSAIIDSAEEIADVSLGKSNNLLKKKLKDEIIRESQILLKSLEEIDEKKFRFRIYLHETISGGNITSYNWLHNDGYSLPRPKW